MSEKYQAPSVKKAFNILRLIVGSEPGMTISELSKQLNMSKGTVHGITAALEEEGALVRDPTTKRYKPGVTLFELSQTPYARIDFKEKIHPYLERLMERTEETVFFGVKNGNSVTIIDSVESMQDLKITSPIGTRLPLLAGAVGKAFLASFDDKSAIEFLSRHSLPKYTEKSITTPEAYLKELKVVQKQGFATDDEEYITGVRATAAPIHSDNHLMFAVWVVGFKSRLPQMKMDILTEATRQTADAIVQELRKHFSHLRP